MTNKKTFDELSEEYDSRYLGGYRSSVSGYEYARWYALDHFLGKILKPAHAGLVLDYGAGSGLFLGLIEKNFPDAALYFCDASPAALGLLTQKCAKYINNCFLVKDNRAQVESLEFDVIISIEVMEHVMNLQDYIRDIKRLLKPGGQFIWTTPCANRFSIEHIYSALTGSIERTSEGYRRWRWEESSHVRRLKSGEVKTLLKDEGFSNIEMRYRAHFFSFVASRLFNNRYKKFGEKLMLLDYAIFRKLPNGASMIGSAVRQKEACD